MFLRLFVSSIELKYRKADKRLLAYKGLSNIPSDEGEIQTVSIDYNYPPGGTHEQ